MEPHIDPGYSFDFLLCPSLESAFISGSSVQRALRHRFNPRQSISGASSGDSRTSLVIVEKLDSTALSTHFLFNCHHDLNHLWMLNAAVGSVVRVNESAGAITRIS